MSLVRKLIGIALVIAAIGGLIISIAGLVLLWQVESRVTAGLQNGVELLIQTLETTSEGLVVTQQALQGSVDTISALQSTVETTATTIKSSVPLVEEINKLMGKELPNTILSTQQSLIAAQDSAMVIEGVLSTLSKIPLIGAGINYDPETPLSGALGNVAASLEDLPNSFANMKDSLTETSSNLDRYEADLTMMAASIGQIESSVAQYENVVGGYQASLDQLQSDLKRLEASLPQIVRMVMIGLTVFLVWMAIAQLGLFTQGIELITEGKGRKEKRAEEEEESVEEKVESAIEEEEKKD